MLRMSEQSDANCSRSTNASKLVIDFLDEPFAPLLIMIEKYFSALHSLKRGGTDDCHSATLYPRAKQQTTQSSSILHKPLGYDVVG